MKWWFHLGWLVPFIFSSCLVSDVGKSCKLPPEAQKQVKESGNKEIRVAVPSFKCALSYCFATYYDPEKPEYGYCSKICNDVSECPSAEKYECKPIILLKKEALPPEQRDSLAALIDKKICIKKPPVIQ